MMTGSRSDHINLPVFCLTLELNAEAEVGGTTLFQDLEKVQLGLFEMMLKKELQRKHGDNARGHQYLYNTTGINFSSSASTAGLTDYVIRHVS